MKVLCCVTDWQEKVLQMKKIFAELDDEVQFFSRKDIVNRARIIEKNR